MQLKFETNQEFQLQAIAAVADLLDGQPRIETELTFSLGSTAFAAIPNRMDLTEAELLVNLHTVQRRKAFQPIPSFSPSRTASRPRPAPKR